MICFLLLRVVALSDAHALFPHLYVTPQAHPPRCVLHLPASGLRCVAGREVTFAVSARDEGGRAVDDPQQPLQAR